MKPTGQRPDDPSVGAYEASKTLAEKAAWDFVDENPDIALTTINPGRSLRTANGRALRLVA
jgi:hypothetical protein